MNQNKSTEINELLTALSLAQAELKVAPKDSNNPFFKSQYANLKSVIESSRAALCKHGLSVVQIVTQHTATTPNGLINEGQYLVTVLGHKSGQWIQSCMKITPLKNDPQSLGSYITYLRRYAYAAIVGVYDGFEDDDGNKASHTPEQKTNHNKSANITALRIEEIVKLLDGNVLKYREILAQYNANELAGLKEYEADEVIKNLSK